MGKIARFFKNWYHRIMGQAFVVVENGRDKYSNVVTVFHGWVGEFHIADYGDGKELTLYLYNRGWETVHIKEFTDVLIGWEYSFWF